MRLFSNLHRIRYLQPLKPKILPMNWKTIRSYFSTLHTTDIRAFVMRACSLQTFQSTLPTHLTASSSSRAKPTTSERCLRGTFAFMTTHGSMMSSATQRSAITLLTVRGHVNQMSEVSMMFSVRAKATSYHLIVAAYTKLTLRTSNPNQQRS